MKILSVVLALVSLGCAHIVKILPGNEPEGKTAYKELQNILREREEIPKEAKFPDYGSKKVRVFYPPGSGLIIRSHVILPGEAIRYFSCTMNRRMFGEGGEWECTVHEIGNEV
jgi:hypothetical protein